MVLARIGRLVRKFSDQVCRNDGLAKHQPDEGAAQRFIAGSYLYKRGEI